MSYAVETLDLTRTFKKGKKKNNSNSKQTNLIMALDKVTLTINPGELFGVLGPNGAGKTTLIKILSTLLLPTSGIALVDNIDVVKYPEKVRKKINMVSGGEHSGYGILTVRENLWLFSQLYGMNTKLALQRIDELLKFLGMEEYARLKISKLSTGMRQKMNIIRGFVCDPQILFLDEPTLGLDVQISREVRKYIKSWVKENQEKTVLLTTHYMAEADELCDRVAVIDNGKVLACDSPFNLKKSLKQDAVFHIEVNLMLENLDRFINIPGVKKFAFEHKPHIGRTDLKFILENDSYISGVTEAISNNGSEILSLSKTEPTLEDVFVSLCGKGLENENRAEN
jgi:ABC-2 type transport system ATP-binding protein